MPKRKISFSFGKSSKRRKYGGKRFRRRSARRLRVAVLRTLTKTSERHRSFVAYNYAQSTTEFIGHLVSAPGIGEAKANYNTDDNPIRDGYKIRVVSLRLRINMILGDVTNLLRIVVFRWYDVPQPQASDLFDTTSGPLYFAGYKTGTRKYKIVWDKLFNLHTSRAQITFEKKFRRLGTITYSDTGRLSWTKGMWFIFAVSDSSAPPSPSINIFSKSSIINI